MDESIENIFTPEDIREIDALFGRLADLAKVRRRRIVAELRAESIELARLEASVRSELKALTRRRAQVVEALQAALS